MGSMTPFGKLLRRERKERGILLGDFADQLRISSSYLSQIETGDRALTQGFEEKVIAAFGLSPSDALEFRRAAAQSRSEFNISLGNRASSSDRMLASELAMGFARLSPEKKRQIREILTEDKRG